MKIAAISDLHGELPDIPECDILLIAGDICPGGKAVRFEPIVQMKFLQGAVAPWLDSIPARHVVATWGNHDFIGEDCLKYLVPRGLRWTMLVDDYVVVEGLKIYGLPWQLPFLDYAFNLSEEGCERKYRHIPDDTDIIISHGPPHGYGDLAPRRITDRNEEQWPAGENCGSPSFTRRIFEVKPQLVVFGHIHEGRGVWDVDGVTLANVTRVDRYFTVHYPPFEIELSSRKTT